MNLFISIAGGLWGIFAAIWVITARQATGKRKRNWSALATFGLIAIGATVIMQMVPADVLLGRLIPDVTEISLVGFTPLVSGMLFAVFARLHLGEQWSAIPAINEGHILIRTGPYKIVRHPIYTGVYVALLGTAIIVGITVFFILVWVVFLGFLIKAHYEEEMLLDEFGDEYEDYKQQAKMIIPWVI